MRNKFSTGFSRVDITPERYGPMGGYGDDRQRICNNVLDRIYATCVAVTDETGDTVLLYSCDLLKVTSEIAIPAQKLIAETLGIPEDHIVFNATHTHAGPSVTQASEFADAYIASLHPLMLKAAKEALADRAPTTVQAGKKIVEGMTFVRHYLMNDGNYSGPNFGKESRASGYKAHADVADEQLQVIRFVRENARDIVLANWQCHATTTGHFERSLTNLSADYIGSMRNHLEGLSGCHFICFVGASGNLVPGSQIEGEARVTRDHIAYGKILAEEAVSLMETDMQPVKTGPAKAKRVIYTAPVDHSDDHLAEKARYVHKTYYELTDKEERRALVKEAGFNSVHHAKGIANRARLGSHMNMEINAISFGEIGFATVPYEMFCSNGMFVKDNSPYPVTFMLSNTDATRSYLPDANAFRYDCYEVNVRLYPNGVAEDIAQTLVNMLTELNAE